MEKARIIKVFLASPSDVEKERDYVVRTIAEVNRDIALKQGVILHLISSERASPGFGKDGQAILMDKIAPNMKVFDLFLGIMWSRIGKRTPRAISGTVEEFRRAERAFGKYGQPDIWFFVRNAPIQADNQEQLDQKSAVLKFKQELQRKSLMKEYKTYTEFREKLREYLIDLVLRIGKRQLEADNDKLSPKPSSPVKRARTPTEKRSPKAPPALKTALARSSTLSAGRVREVTNWAMIGNEFYRLKAVRVHGDKTAVLRLAPLSSSQPAQLRSLQPNTFHRSKELPCAYEHEAGFMQVQSVESETAGGEAAVTIKLSPSQGAQSGAFMTEVTYQNYGPEEVALARVRLILLNEPLPRDLARFIPSVQIGNYPQPVIEIKEGIFPTLWTRLQTTTQSFLPKAWLWAMFALKASNIIEEILVLELGPITKKVMSVRFEGKRRRDYPNQEPSIIRLEGECRLET